MKPKKTKICPKCGSKNLQIDITLTAAVGLPQKFKCGACGFESFLVAEEEKWTKKIASFARL